MECFHFSEQRFPRISLNKVPIISVQHFLLLILDYRHISFQPPFMDIVNATEICALNLEKENQIENAELLPQKISLFQRNVIATLFRKTYILK